MLQPGHGVAPCTALLAAALVVAACGRRGGDDSAGPTPQGRDSAEAERTAPASRGAAVVFEPDGRPPARVSVEVARTPRQIQRGLMYRRHLPPDAGMLFLFRQPEVQSFWMKNTLIPLDMIFVSSEMIVVGVVENAEPQTLTSRTVGVPSQYVVEVNGGWASAHGVAAGTPVRFENVRPLAED